MKVRGEPSDWNHHRRRRRRLPQGVVRALCHGAYGPSRLHAYNSLRLILLPKIPPIGPCPWPRHKPARRFRSLRLFALKRARATRFEASLPVPSLNCVRPLMRPSSLAVATVVDEPWRSTASLQGGRAVATQTQPVGQSKTNAFIPLLLVVTIKSIKLLFSRGGFG